MASEEHDKVVQAMVAQLANPPAQPPSLEEQRAQSDEASMATPLRDDVVCEPVDVAGVPAEWVSTSESEDARVVLYLHGGGYVFCSIATHRELASRIARASRARCLLLGYRLAPEHPFPAAVEDATAAYRWLLAEGVSPQHLVVAGDSAGGGLALATLFSLRDAGDPLPAAGACLSPWADLEMTGDSTKPGVVDDPLVTLESLTEMAQQYASESDLRSPLASPVHGNYRGLPPLLIQVGTRELLLDDSVRLAERAKAHGVDVSLETWDGLVHVWPLFAPAAPESDQAVARIGEFVAKHTA